MSKHKSDDYKLSAVKYYLSNSFSLDYVCNILVVKNNHYQDGLKDIRRIKNYKDIIELTYHIK